MSLDSESGSGMDLCCTAYLEIKQEFRTEVMVVYVFSFF